MKDLGGGFAVRRLLPAAERQAVGPFLFFDHFGPVTAGPNDNHDVRPHPHIGLATSSSTPVTPFPCHRLPSVRSMLWTARCSWTA